MQKGTKILLGLVVVAVIVAATISQTGLIKGTLEYSPEEISSVQNLLVEVDDLQRSFDERMNQVDLEIMEREREFMERIEGIDNPDELEERIREFDEFLRDKENERELLRTEYESRINEINMRVEELPRMEDLPSAKYITFDDNRVYSQPVPMASPPVPPTLKSGDPVPMTTPPMGSPSPTPTFVPTPSAVLTQANCDFVLGANDKVITGYQKGVTSSSAILIDSGGYVDTDGRGSNNVYMKNGAAFDSSGGGSNTIYFESQANIIDGGAGSTLIKCSNINFIKPTSAVLEVSLSSGQPYDTISVPSQKDRDILRIDFTAKKDAVILDGITLKGMINDNEVGGEKDWGFGSDTDGLSTAVLSTLVADAAIYDGNTKVSFNNIYRSSGDLRFSNLNLNIPANTTKTLVLKVNYGPNTTFGSEGDNISFIVNDVNLVDAKTLSGGNVAVQLRPSKGVNVDETNKWTGIGPIHWATLEPHGLLNISGHYNQVVNQSVSAGSSNVLLSKISIDASLEDYKINRMTFDVKGSNISNDLRSITVKYPLDVNKPSVLDGKQTYAISWGSSEVVMDNLNMMIGTSGIVNIEVYGDISSNAVSGDNVQVNLLGVSNDMFRFRAMGFDSNQIMDDCSSVIGNPTMIK